MATRFNKPSGILLILLSHSTYLTTAPPETITATSISISVQPASTIVTIQLVTLPASTVTTLSVQPASTVTTLSLSIQPASTITTLSVQPASTVTTLSIQPASTVTTLSVQPASTVTTLSAQPASTITVRRLSDFQMNCDSFCRFRDALLDVYQHAEIFSQWVCLHRERFANRFFWIWSASRERIAVLEQALTRSQYLSPMLSINEALCIAEELHYMSARARVLDKMF